MRNLSKWLKKYFIPHKDNEFKPHLLRHESMMLFLLAIIIIELGFIIQIFVVFNKTNFLASVLPGVLTSLTNEERAQNDAPPLTENALLNKAAELKAQDMATNGYFAHISPDGKTPWYWFEKVGYSFNKAGENLAVNFFESSDVARAWMNSPTHRANIVKKDYKEIGIGIANGIYQGKNTVFVVQFFGTPMQVSALPTKTTKDSPLVTSAKKILTPKLKVSVTPSPIITTPPISNQILGEETTTAPIVAESKNLIFYKFKSALEKILISPRKYTTYAYSAIALLVLFALLLVTFIKSETKRPKIIMRGFALMAVIISLLFINIKILHLETTVPSNDVTASAIEYIN